MTTLGRAMRLVTLIACCVGAGVASADDFPTRTITIIVPYPAGGPTDTLARQLAPIMADRLGQAVIVENISGGATNVATGHVVNAAPDGHTLLLHNLQISANVSLYPRLPFDVEKNLTPIMFINNNPLLLVGRKTLAANSYAELAAWMKTLRAKIGNPGVGSTGHLATTLFAQALGTPVDQIPYRGGTPMFQDILGGIIDLTFGTPQQSIPQIKGSLVKVYAVTAKARMPQLPEAVSLVDALGPNLEILYWNALFAPAGTPNAVVARINAVVNEAIEDPSIAKNWAESGMTPYPEAQRTPEAAKALLHGEIERWGEVVRKNGINASN